MLCEGQLEWCQYQEGFKEVFAKKQGKCLATLILVDCTKHINQQIQVFETKDQCEKGCTKKADFQKAKMVLSDSKKKEEAKKIRLSGKIPYNYSQIMN